MKKEPFLQVSKRRNKARWQERLLIRFIALILALIVCGAVIVALVKMNPVDVYKAIWDGAMGSDRRLWQTIRDTMVLLCISIGLAPAFKMKFWNIGAEGQILIGGACSAAVMIYAGDKMPTGLLLIVMFVASALGGMIWGMIPAVFKANWNTNETLFTLMLNYVAMQVVTYCIVFWEIRKVPIQSVSSIRLQRRMASGIVRTEIWLECSHCPDSDSGNVYLSEIL